MTAHKADSAKRRFTRIYIYVMLMVYPVFTGFAGYANITTSKLVFFIAATVLWLALLLVCSVIYRSFGEKRLNIIQILMLVYLGFCCISALFSPLKSFVLTGAGRFDGLLETALYVCIFLGVSRYAMPERGFVYALAISVTLCCVAAILQFLGYNPLNLFPDGYNYYDKGTLYSGEFLGTIGNANLFSAFLALCLPIFICFFIFERRRRFFLLPVIALGVYCLFTCTVSAGKLALFVCAFFAAPALILKMTKLNRRRFLYFYVAFLVIASVSAFLYLTKFYSGTEGTLYEFSRILHGEIEDSFGSSRILIWRDSLKLTGDKLLFGGGPGTIALRLNISFSRFVEETGRTLVTRVDNAHNVYLGILVNTGIFSLLAYLAAMAVTIVKALKLPQERALALSFTCGLLCYWIQDFFGLGLFIVAPIMFICWGLAIAKPEPVHE